MVSQRHSHPATARLRTAREGISHVALDSKPEDSVGAEIRILIADDFDDWRIRTRDILRQQKNWCVVGEACDGEEAVRRATELHPDVVLLDIAMPSVDGIEAARKIRRRSPNSNIIFVTQFDDRDIMNTAFEVGAKGYVVKMQAGNQLVKAISSAISNGH